MIIIDGHNLIGASKDIELSDPEAKSKLIDKLFRFREILNVNVTVVFDGKDDADIGRLMKNNIEIFFPNASETADEVICKLCSKYSHAKDTVIVSSDREIVNYARKNHLISKTSKDFVCEVDDIVFRGQDNNEYLSPVDLEDWLKYFNRK